MALEIHYTKDHMMCAFADKLKTGLKSFEDNY